MDCLSPEFDTVKNWGQSGAGNSYIFNSIMEADQRNRIGPDDTVMFVGPRYIEMIDMCKADGTR